MPLPSSYNPFMECSENRSLSDVLHVLLLQLKADPAHLR